MSGETPPIEVLDLAEQEDEESSFTPHFSIASYGADYPVDSLINRMRNNTIFVPPFQRAFVWKKPQASRFVESLLLGLPVPGIFLAKEQGETQRMLVVDGQQRLTTLRRFYDNDFDGRPFKLVGVGEHYEGKGYSDLSAEDRRRMDDTTIHATVVRQERPEADDSSIFMIFERLNTGGVTLTAQEIRSTVSRGAFNNLLGELNLVPAWRRVFGGVSARRKDQELILRFAMLYFDLGSYRRPMREALNSFMYRNRELSLISGESIRTAFVRTIAAVDATLGATAFRPSRVLNAAVFDAVMVGLARRLSDQEEYDPSRLERRYNELLNDSAFQEAYYSFTSAEERVERRIALASDYFTSV